MSSLTHKKSQRRVNAERSTRNITTGIKGLLLNETLTVDERRRTQEALALLEENLKDWRKGA